MSKSEKWFLILALLAAITVMAIFALDVRALREETSSLSRQLQESTASWNAINDEKVALQQELKSAQEELREAELTLAESETRAEELRRDIADLESEIEILSQQVTTR